MKKNERREHKRFKVLSGVFALNTKFGQVDDISLGGISFRYIDRQPCSTAPEERGFLFGDDDLCLDNIPITTVSDEIVSGGVATESTTVRRRSVRFGPLTITQRNMLEHFIWVNTSAEASISSAR